MIYGTTLLFGLGMIPITYLIVKPIFVKYF